VSNTGRIPRDRARSNMVGAHRKEASSALYAINPTAAVARFTIWSGKGQNPSALPTAFTMQAAFRKRKEKH